MLLRVLCLGALSWGGRGLIPCLWFRASPEAALWMLMARPPGPEGFSSRSLCQQGCEKGTVLASFSGRKSLLSALI